MKTYTTKPIAILEITTNIMTTFDAAPCRCWLETLVEKFDVWVFECDVGLADEG